MKISLDKLKFCFLKPLLSSNKKHLMLLGFTNLTFFFRYLTLFFYTNTNSRMGESNQDTLIRDDVKHFKLFRSKTWSPRMSDDKEKQIQNGQLTLMPSAFSIKKGK